ncbi:MAG: hypothetical protein KIS66_03625 [Fimbriimonadaceae bacterium]|nr:hypothetical protein [Fimbriimonadaceae bacterium]
MVSLAEARVLHLGPTDLIVVGVFLAALFGLGFSARVRGSSALQLIAAGRSLSLPLFVATLVSTWYGGILGVGESVGYYGVGAWALIGVPYYAFAVVYALWLAKRVRRAAEISIPERLETKWGRAAGLVGAVLVFLLAVPAAHALMIGVLVQALTGWATVLSVLVGSFVATLFLYRGGLLADARASLLAFLMMYVGFGAMVAFTMSRVPLTEAIARLDPPLRTWDGGTGLPFVVSFFILGAWTLVDPGFHQRVASAASMETGRRGVLVSVLFWMLFDFLSISTGIYAVTGLAEKPSNALLIYPAFGEATLPDGLKAVFVCGMLGTIVAAMVGYTLVSGATLGREIVARASQAPLDDPRVALWTRLGFFAATLIAVGLALTVQSVVALWYSWAGAVVGALLLPMALAYRARPYSGRASWVIGSMVASFGAAVTWMIVGTSQGNPFLSATLPNGQTFSVGTLLPGLAVSALALGTGSLVGTYKEDRR